MAKRVVVAGTFDGIHPGHESFLTQARALGDELVVILARDETVERRKGHPPRRNETERLAAVSALPMVSRAVLGNVGKDYLKVVVDLTPQVLALGYDQWPDKQKLAAAYAKRGLTELKIIRLEAFEPEKYHSSLLENENPGVRIQNLGK